ncbi:hypothetical protein GGR53DRAFT_74279 [Hypoxylon sp. FL1150]|nr:hypothetical protein GGR53DRAFT_74279 [Hypoxylon sp. FL1150]
MCRHIITHQMHHDVRRPMVIDPETDHPLVFANPLRTSHHQCEVSMPKPGSTVLESHFPTCRWHSCCIPETKVEFCDWFQDNVCNDEGNYDPFGCMYRIEEHRHVPLEYLGDREAYADLTYPVIATWDRNIYELNCNWAHWFHRESFEFQQWCIEEGWDEEYYSACELLYTQSADVEIHHAVYFDMLMKYPAGHAMVSAAWQNIERATDSLEKQKEEVAYLLQLARDSRCRPPLAYDDYDSKDRRQLIQETNGLPSLMCRDDLML